MANPKRFGLPKPDHHFSSALVTISENLLNRIGDGRVQIKPHIARLDGSTVTLKTPRHDVRHYMHGNQSI